MPGTHLRDIGTQRRGLSSTHRFQRCRVGYILFISPVSYIWVLKLNPYSRRSISYSVPQRWVYLLVRASHPQFSIWRDLDGMPRKYSLTRETHATVREEWPTWLFVRLINYAKSYIQSLETGLEETPTACHSLNNPMGYCTYIWTECYRKCSNRALYRAW